MIKETEISQDLLEYFLELDDKYDVTIDSKYIVDSFLKDSYSVSILFNHKSLIQKVYKSPEIVSDVWDCVRMVNSIGEFVTKKDNYCEIKWIFKVPYLILPSVPNRKIAFIGDKEFSDFNNLIDVVRKTTKGDITEISGYGDDLTAQVTCDEDLCGETVRNILKYIEEDFTDGLVVNSFVLVFQKVK